MALQRTAVPGGSHAPELDIKSILLLDDDIELADTLKQLLETHNFIVKTVKNGVEGVREIMSLDYDIIMCDMMMPAMAGDMFYLAVQRTKPHLCPRFIFVTGYRDNPKVNKFLKSINAMALFKPVNNDELIRTISFVIKKTGSESSGR